MYNPRLKMTQEHYSEIESKIQQWLGNHSTHSKGDLIAAYENGLFPRSDKVKDLHKRFRWDLFDSAISSKWVSNVLYPYLDDSHIDSALKLIVPKVERKY